MILPTDGGRKPLHSPVGPTMHRHPSTTLRHSVEVPPTHQIDAGLVAATAQTVAAVVRAHARVVSNNGGWTAVERGLEKPGRDLRFSRYDKMVAALGAHAEYVETPEQIRPALERAFASGRAAVVNVRGDEAARSSTVRFSFYRMSCPPGGEASCAQAHKRAKDASSLSLWERRRMRARDSITGSLCPTLSSYLGPGGECRHRSVRVIAATCFVECRETI
jgi:hypothetical protein